MQRITFALVFLIWPIRPLYSDLDFLYSDLDFVKNQVEILHRFVQGDANRLITEKFPIPTLFDNIWVPSESSFYDKIRHDPAHKRKWCASWFISERISTFIGVQSPFAFNIRCISDKVQDGESNKPQDNIELDAVYEDKYNEGVYNVTVSLDVRCRPIKLVLEGDVKEKVCYKCHNDKPKSWVFCYRFYYPNLKELETKFKENK